MSVNLHWLWRTDDTNRKFRKYRLRMAPEVLLGKDDGKLEFGQDVIHTNRKMVLDISDLHDKDQMIRQSQVCGKVVFNARTVVL